MNRLKQDRALNVPSGKELINDQSIATKSAQEKNRKIMRELVWFVDEVLARQLSPDEEEVESLASEIKSLLEDLLNKRVQEDPYITVLDSELVRLFVRAGICERDPQDEYRLMISDFAAKMEY